LPPVFMLVSLGWSWRWYVPLKRQLTFNGLHGIMSPNCA
jgi:hypothetical protein